MPNMNKKIIERLLDNNEPEMMPHELEQLLDEELAKPEEEMDTRLITDLVELMDVEAPSELDRKKDWKAIRKRLRKGKRLPRALRGLAIAVASVVAVFFISFATARAFNWTVLLKILLPVAQTFGIVSSDYTIDDGQESPYSFEDADDEIELDFYSLDDLPSSLADAVIESNCIPQRFQFDHVTWYQDPVMEKYSFSYADGEQWLTLEVMEFTMASAPTIDFEFERQSDLPQAVDIDGVEVTLYYNSENLGMSASWILGGTHYNLQGTLSEEELTYIVRMLRIHER